MCKFFWAGRNARPTETNYLGGADIPVCLGLIVGISSENVHIA